MATQWIGWVPQAPTVAESLVPGISTLLQVLLLQREKEQEVANQVYEATNWRIYDLVTNQGFDVADAVDLVRTELESHPQWERIRRAMETYTPHAIGTDGEGKVTFRYTPPRDILIMQAETEQNREIMNHQAELEAQADYRRYGLEEDRTKLNHELNKEMTYLVHTLERENMELSLEHQKELMRLENELNKALTTHNLEEAHRLSLEMEQFLHDLGLEKLAQEFQYQIMLNAQLAAIEEGHMMVDRETQAYLQSQAHILELARMKEAQGLEEESAKFYDQLERDRELWREERIVKPAEERAEAAQARLMELDNKLQEGRIVLEADQSLRLQNARDLFDLLKQAIAHGNEQEILRLQSELQKEIIALEVELQLGSAKELEAFRNELIQINMELEYGYTENLETHRANLQYLVQSGLITDQGVMNIIENYINHLNSLEYLKQQGAQDIELQEHHQRFQAEQADIDRGLARNIPREQWTSLFIQNLNALKDQVGELSDEDYQTAFYLTLDQITEWNEDGTSDREEKLVQLFQALQYFPQLDATKIVGEDVKLLESKGVIQPIQSEQKPKRSSVGGTLYSVTETLFPEVTKDWLEDMPVTPKGTSSYAEIVNWLNWLMDPLNKTGDSSLFNLLEQLSPQGVTQPQSQLQPENLSPLEKALLGLEEEDRDSDIYLRRILSWPSVRPYFNLPYNQGAK